MINLLNIISTESWIIFSDTSTFWTYLYVTYTVLQIVLICNIIALESRIELRALTVLFLTIIILIIVLRWRIAKIESSSILTTTTKTWKVRLKELSLTITRLELRFRLQLYKVSISFMQRRVVKFDSLCKNYKRKCNYICFVHYLYFIKL